MAAAARLLAALAVGAAAGRAVRAGTAGSAKGAVVPAHLGVHSVVVGFPV